MIGLDNTSKALINKLREILKECSINTFGQDGTFAILANKKVLHGRTNLNLIDKIVLKEYNLHSALRVLLHSKGIARKDFMENVI